MTATLSDLTDWADATNLIGAPGVEGLLILPANGGKFTVYYNEFSPIDDMKHKKAAMDRGHAAMVAMFKYLTVNKIPFAMYLHGDQPRFTVNAIPGERVELRKLNYFYRLHIDATVRRYSTTLDQDYMRRIDDDGR